MTLRTKFEELFLQKPLLVRSPGRVNLIGEHTDYNEGFVMPASIEKEIRLGIAKNNLSEIHIFSLDYQQSIVVKLAELSPLEENSWANFILGIVTELQVLGHTLEGFNCVFEGDIPLGAGLSSSAALECATVFALNELFNLGLDRMTMVKVAQKAENNFVGVKCGIMDQFASMFGQANQVIQLDCRSLDYQYSPLQLNDYKIVLLDTQVKHSLADSAYNTRRSECEAGVSFLQKHHPEIKSLRDASPELLEKYKDQMDPVVYQRCHYVVSENQRVRRTSDALKQGNLKEVGDQMYASHQGLQHEYEVSCKELDFLVEKAKTFDAVLGARMMGGGFGGCTINLVAENEVANYIEQMTTSYKSELNQELKAYVCNLGQGTGLIKD